MKHATYHHDNGKNSHVSKFLYTLWCMLNLYCLFCKMPDESVAVGGLEAADGLVNITDCNQVTQDLVETLRLFFRGLHKSGRN